MKPKPRQSEEDDRLRPRLVDLIDMRHELVKLGTLIDWEFFEREWSGFFPSGTGRPATSPRLVAGLLYLQHAFALSDEAVVAVGREPLLPALLWRDVRRQIVPPGRSVLRLTPAPSADRLILPPFRRTLRRLRFELQ